MPTAVGGCSHGEIFFANDEGRLIIYVKVKPFQASFSKANQHTDGMFL